MQTRELREYCERRGWTVAGEYVDIGISGTKEKRPELDRLLGEAHRRRFDAVSHLLRALETFKSLEFVSLSEQVDTSTPTGKMVFTVLCRGRAGAIPYRRTGASWSQEREGERKVPRSAPRCRGRCEDCSPAFARALLGEDWGAVGL
jgi:hypothetical protein